MDDPIYSGRPFEVGRLWPKSLLPDLPEAQGLFQPLDTEIESLPPANQASHALFALDVSLPGLEDQGHALQPSTTEVEQSPSAITRDQDADEDGFIWDLDINECDDGELPRLCTWEQFQKKDGSGAENSSYLSEAGPAAFDVLVNSVEDNIGVLPQGYVLRSLCLLALGRSSSLFQLDDADGKFALMLEGATTTGLSASCSMSMTQDLMGLGSTIAKLRTFANSLRGANACPAAVALRSSVAIVLDAIEQNIATQVGSIRSALQLQHLVMAPHRLLRLLDAMREGTRGINTDEVFISCLAEIVQESSESEHRFCAVLQSILARVSTPWLEHLLADLGLGPAMPGQTGGSPTNRRDYSPMFLHADDQNLLELTQEAVDLLRDQCPTHPLLLKGQESLSFRVVDPNRAPSQSDEIAREYAEMVAAAVLDDKPGKLLGRLDAHLLSNVSEYQTPWHTSDDGYLSDLGAQMSSGPEARPMEAETLHQDVLKAIDSDPSSTSPTELLTQSNSSLIDQFRPLIRMQHRLVNAVLLRQILRKHNLRKQLELQRSFQLLGNGTFVGRLSRALFDREMQSAERKRGAIPTGDEFGLRVGTMKDQRWPPASSELQLTLMGLLTDATSGDTEMTTQPALLSFSIRELPEEEIERVLDPYSIYALDFLRLQYTVAAPVDAVITTTSLNHYDLIFRYLLKLLRLLHVTADLPRYVEDSRSEPAKNETLAFAQRARAFVTVLAEHTMSIGILPCWRPFIASVKSLEDDLRYEDEHGKFGIKATMDIQALRLAHETCLDRIRTRLFLKKRQQKQQEAIENVLSSILKCATGLQMSISGVVEQAEHKQFRDRVMHLLRVLADAVEKPAKTSSLSGAEDADMTRVLLAKLDWNGFYTGHDDSDIWHE